MQTPWEVMTVGGYREGNRYLIRNRINGGYVANNGDGGGAIHFLVLSEAESICELLNHSYTA